MFSYLSDLQYMPRNRTQDLPRNFVRSLATEAKLLKITNGHQKH